MFVVTTNSSKRGISLDVNNTLWVDACGIGRLIGCKGFRGVILVNCIPAANTLLLCAGLESLLPFDHWHLSTALGAAQTGRVAHVCQVLMSFASVVFPLLAPCSKVRTACKSAQRHGTWGWSLLWKDTLKKGLFCDDPQLPCGIWHCIFFSTSTDAVSTLGHAKVLKSN